MMCIEGVYAVTVYTLENSHGTSSTCNYIHQSSLLFTEYLDSFNHLDYDGTPCDWQVHIVRIL